MIRYLESQWQAAPARPRLARCCVDVWRIGLPLECAAGHTSRGQQGQQSETRRAMLEILARYLAITPEAVGLGVRSGGKPFLESPQSPLRFNLTHTVGLGLLALSPELELGIDVETRRTIDRPVRLARRVMPASHVTTLENLSGESQLAAFFEYWTLLESRQKALGRGIFAEAVDQRRLSCWSFRPAPEYFAALCVSPPSPEVRVRFFDYLPP